ncbi:hypothetical protein B7P43_G15186 [Cryptotermes secundus]|uniref:Uncharacterized protein n=1 Tax=Cryptotermes secundus TaxID=105785 RepID=A0A2J7PML0_9NEOP|nr:hypothetical protein B7P43_G15186 [Cryptotermes secundus]
MDIKLDRLELNLWRASHIYILGHWHRSLHNQSVPICPWLLEMYVTPHLHCKNSSIQG